MRNLQRIPKIVKLLEKAWKLEPDLRLGQLLWNIGGAQNHFYIEDTEWKKMIEDFIDSYVVAKSISAKKLLKTLKQSQKEFKQGKAIKAKSLKDLK